MTTPRRARTPAAKPLWRCPKCGHRFVTRNLWHSCVRVPLAARFSGRPGARRLFDAWRAFVRRCGPFTVYAQKSRIVFQTRARFTGAVVRRGSLASTLWLKRRAAHPLFTRVERLGGKDWLHHFVIRDAGQLDTALLDLVREAYAVGSQQALVRVSRRAAGMERAGKRPAKPVGRRAAKRG